MSQEHVERVSGTRINLRDFGGDESRRRSVDERVFLQFPVVYRLLASALTWLPRRSRFRRALLARRIRQAYAAANRHDFDAVLLGWDRQGEYRPSAEMTPPDMETSFQGHDGYLRLWRYWLDAFEDIRWDPQEILDLGQKLVVTTRQAGHGSGSGVAVSKPVFQLFELRRGLVVRQHDFLDRSSALQAAGLRE